MASTNNSERRVTVILPCLNEHEVVGTLCDEIEALYPRYQRIVVDDGSEPPIPEIPGVTVLRHPQNIGNGAAVKTGVRHASGDFVVFMDADGQHDAAEIKNLVDKLEAGYDLVIGARSADGQASWWRRMANQVFNRLATLMTGFDIQDLTSGFRAARAKPFRNFLYLLPNGFSYPTTSTMAFFRCGYSVSYVPIRVRPRVGKSNIRLLNDGFRFLIIILRIGTLFSPMRFFLPISAVLFLLGSIWYGYTFTTLHRFTNMSALLYLSSLIIFVIGVLSEQVSSLHYRYSEERRRHTDA